MNISKKLLPASLTAVLIASVLTGCPSKEVPADQAIKEAYNQFTAAAYNFEGYMTASIKEDESALIGTKGGLTPEQAEEELDFLEEMQSPDAKTAIAMINNGKLSLKGAVDSKNMKYETFFDISYEMNGVKGAFEVPTLIELKDNPSLYIDPKAAKAFNMLPPQVGTKLVKMTIDDIPGLSPAEKSKFKSVGPLISKYQKIIYSSVQKMDASMFKDIDASDAAKKAGAVRVVQVTITPEQNDKMSQEMTTELMQAVSADFDIPKEKMAEIKEAMETSNKEAKLFMGNTVTNYGLNDKGQIVYMSYQQSFKGAKHVADMNFVVTMKDYDKPTFVIDPAKQGTVSVLELMMSMR